MRKINFFAYITVALAIGLVYTFGELKYEKKLAKAKELWLLEDAEELAQEIDRYKETIQILAKQNREYEIILQTIKLKIAEQQQAAQNGEKPKEEKPKTQEEILKKSGVYYQEPKKSLIPQLKDGIYRAPTRIEV